MNRRIGSVFALSALALLGLTAVADGHNRDGSGPAAANADEAIVLLREGNERFVSGEVEHVNAGMSMVELTSAAGQTPFATFVACADSRVPVERVFDRGVGELFVHRIAGNIMTPEIAGSIEYGVGVLGTPVVVVLGHTSCGAVGAAAGNADVGGNIGSVLAPIRESVFQVERRGVVGSTEIVEAAVRQNVFNTIEDLLIKSKDTRDRARSGDVKIVGAVYDLKTGTVEWIGPHPLEERILSTGG